MLRTFNPRINSKSGIALPPGQTRGTPEWREFEELLISCLSELGHEVVEQMENPREPANLPADFTITVHKTSRDCPSNLYYMQMHLRDLFTLDTAGWGADHSTAFSTDGFLFEDEFVARDFCVALSDFFHSTGQSKCDQPSQTDATPARFILVPIQIPRDYTILHHSPITVRYFIDSIQEWAGSTQNHVAFKMHPFNKGDRDLHEAVDSACLSPYVHKVEGNIHELIKRSSGLFVINSGTGFEGLVHGRPVATFGHCDYRRVTHNADLRRLDEARNFLFSYSEDQRRLAWQFVYWYIHRHAYRLKSEGVRDRLMGYLKEELSHA